MLSLRDLIVGIGRTRPVDGVSFEIAAGETFALVGESGSGKSMTALALMRLLPSAATIAGGTLIFGGVDVFGLSEARMRMLRGGGVRSRRSPAASWQGTPATVERSGGGMAMIFQEPATSLNPVMTVGRQIAEALALHGEGTDSSRVVELLSAVGIPDPVRRAGEYPFQMSGGMKQRVMIAMALAGAPKLLIADEPTTALDVTIQAQVLDLLKDIQVRRGTAMLLITHDLGVVARMADHIGVMYAGQLVEVAPRTQFFAAPAHPYSRCLFAALPDTASSSGRLATIPGSVPPLDAQFVGCRFADRCSQVMSQCRLVPPPWRELGTGQRMRCHLEIAHDMAPGAARGAAGGDTAAGHGGELLEVRDLQVHFPIRQGILQRTVAQVKAVDGISLRIAAGRTLALVGESGCGKTTAGKAVLGLTAPTGGRIYLEGRSLVGLAPRDMQMVFQDPFASLNPRARIGDIIAEGMKAQGIAGDIDAILIQVGLTADMAGRYPHEFSGGQRQRIAIARALVVNPRLLICDEPTSALDVSVQAQILNLLKELQDRHGLAYLFITHNLGVVSYLAHDVAVMYLGRIVEQGNVRDILHGARHPYTLALLAAVPRLDGSAGERLLVAGDPPSPAQPPAGCHFHPRCPRAMDVCRRDYPETVALSPCHAVCCHLFT